MGAMATDEGGEVLKSEHGRTIRRIGGTVRRDAGWWTPAVHRLLAHLQSVVFGYAPTPLGLDEHGREMVSFINGDHGAACWERIVTDDGIRRFGLLLREYHEAVASFVPPRAARWKLAALADGPDVLVCHGDFAP